MFIKRINILNNEPYLRQISKEVDIKEDKNLKSEIEALAKFCRKHEVMALAAIQIGIPKRIVYLKNTNIEIIDKMTNEIATKEDYDYNEERVLINPVVKNKEGLTEYWEACVSCLDNCGLVYRPYKVDVEFYDMDNNKHLKVFKGFETTVLSHEFDHLDGILHIDIAEEVLHLSKEQRRELRKEQGYHIYNEDGSFSKLLEEKHKMKVLKK